MTTTPPSRFHRPPPHCIRCGYDLAGLPRTEKLCPECGHDARDRAQALLRRYCKPNWVRWAARTAWLMTAAYALFGIAIVLQSVIVVLDVLLRDLDIADWAVGPLFLAHFSSLALCLVFGLCGCASALIRSTMWRLKSPIGSQDASLCLSTLATIPVLGVSIVLPLGLHGRDSSAFVFHACVTAFVVVLVVSHRWAKKTARLLRPLEADEHRDGLLERRCFRVWLILWVPTSVFALYASLLMQQNWRSHVHDPMVTRYIGVLIIIPSALSFTVFMIGLVAAFVHVSIRLRDLDNSIRWTPIAPRSSVPNTAPPA